MSKYLLWLLASSLGCLLIECVGAGLGIATYLPARFGGLLHGRNVVLDFLLLSGTALSPPLVLMVAHALCMLCALSPGRIGSVGVAGLTLLGAGYFIGQLGEPILAQSLNPATFNALHASIALLIIVLSALMVVLGVCEWRQRQLANKTTSTGMATDVRQERR